MPLAPVEAARPEMTALVALIRRFADMPAPDPGNSARLQERPTAARAADLPHVHAFTRGLDPGAQAVTAALSPCPSTTAAPGEPPQARSGAVS